MTQPAGNKIEAPCDHTFFDLEKLSDEGLMAHLQQGHGDALAVLFDRYHRLVLNAALKVLRDITEAEDVMQSVFLEILRVAVQFDPSRGTTKMWILQYAYHRSMNRRQQLVTRQFYTGTGLSDVEEHLSAPNMSVLTSIETRRQVKQALDALNPVQRRVLELAYFEGLSLREISEKTNEALGNVRHHYYRGLAKLRVCLTDAAAETSPVACKEIANAKA